MLREPAPSRQHPRRHVGLGPQRSQATPTISFIAGRLDATANHPHRQDQIVTIASDR